MNGQHRIRIEIAILPYCNHPEFVSTCLYCVDADRVTRTIYTDIIGLQQSTVLNPTKIQVIRGEHGPLASETK